MSIYAKPSIAIGVAFALLTASLGAAPLFVPPTEANPPFRRDRLPIDTDSMSSLSREMERLSLGASVDEAPQRRAAAQALALALALDPANTSAQGVLSDFTEGESRRQDPEIFTRAKARIWQLHGWLATPEAGPDGNLLADLLGDTAAALDPGHPAAVALRASGERGKWDGWVSPLSAFEKAEPVHVEKPPEPPRNKPEPPPVNKPARIALSEASVKTVLYAHDKKEDGYLFGRTVVRMEARPDERQEGEEWRPDGVRFNVPCREEWAGEFDGDVRDFIASPILRALKSAEVPMPKHGWITLRAGDEGNYSFRRNLNAISGAGFLLSHAALTGSVPDATVIGMIDSGGRLVSPSYLWYYVDKLREGEGGRLVIPADAEEHFLALLTLDEPDFFLKYEVFTASTPREFAELCAQSPSAKQASVSSKFKEIKDKAPASSLGPYLANRFVRQRLLDIHAEMPQHLSAKMLAIQGSRERAPRTLSKKVLASVIWQAIAPIDAAIDIDIYSVGSNQINLMDKTYEESREALGLLDRLTERADTDLLTRAKALNSDLRALPRALGSRSDDWDTRYSAISKAYAAVKESNEALRKELSLITGDPLPEAAFDLLRNQRDRYRDQ
jgi:hypothetical protein